MAEHQPRTSPLAGEIFPWIDEFAAGMINDPALVDGTLAPGERVAVRTGPLAAVDLRPSGRDSVVSGVGITGSLLATDQRALILADGGLTREWRWDRDVAGVRFLSHRSGAVFLPTPERYEAGIRLEGIVEPWFARGERPPPSPTREVALAWWKLEGAWRSAQPGGLTAWRTELQELLES
jgi:hypothetical protein